MMDTPDDYLQDLADERRLDWQEQQAEMRQMRRIEEALGHIEAAGLIEEAAKSVAVVPPVVGNKGE